MIKSLIHYTKTQYNTKLWIYMVLFSLFATKSIFISPFTLKAGVLGIVIGLLLWISILLVSMCAIYLFDKINIKNVPKKISFGRIFLYMIPGVVVSTIIWLGVYPAIVPYDTGYLYWESSIGSFNNMHPIVYTMFIDFVRRTFGIFTPIVALQIIYCAFVYGYIGYIFEKNGLRRRLVWIIVTLISIMPVNVIYSVTVVKDVPYIIPVMFISAVIADMVMTDRLGIFHIISLIVASVVAWCSRFNALLTIPATFGFLAILYLIRKQYKRMIIIAIALVVVAGSYKLSTDIAERMAHDDLHVLGGTSTVHIMPSVMLSDIAFYRYRELSDEEIEFAESYIDFGYIHKREREAPGMWQFNYNFMSVMDTDDIEENTDEYYDNALAIIKKYPLDALKAYEKITAIVWAVPSYGYTSTRNAYVCEGFENNHPETAPIVDAIFDFQKYNPILSGQTLFFLWRPALWMLLCLLLLPLAIKRRGPVSLAILAPMLFNAAGYMAANPAQNVRYLYLNATVFVIFMMYTLMKPKDKAENN